MAENTSSVDTVVSTKPGLVTDLNSSYLGKESYSHARNAVRNSKDGDLGTISNEPSNQLCYSAPYPIVGAVTLPDDTHMVFSGDGVNSEIGLGNPKDCTYKTLKNLSCLNFSIKNPPVTGVARKDFNKGTVVYFTDKVNPIRRVEMKKLSKVNDCDDIRLFKRLSQPCLTVSEGESGTMPNGVYSVVIAYSIDNKVFTDWFSITNRIQLFSRTNTNSLIVKLSNVDREFDNFTLAVVGNYIDPVTKGATKLAKVIGSYSTKTTSISITDFNNPLYQNLELSNLVIKKNTWQKAGIISSNSNYLILGDLVGRQEENYQLKAMSIESEYVIEQVDADYYYNKGNDVGYYGDENYDFYIQGVYNSGEETDKFHIPGRLATDDDRSIVSNIDVYEYDTQFKDCETEVKIEKWQVENTAGEMIPYNNEFVCGRRVYGRGEMGYFQSTEMYPDNKAMFGEWANTPIRYPKFPDECKVPRYSTIDGKTYINIKGIRFKNIPMFDNPDIVGYKITRSDRKNGNGTVIARGIMSNTRFYVDTDLQQTIMYSNYGVNNLGPDKFLSKTQTSFRDNREIEFTPLTEYFKDRFNFYSPHTSFEPRYSLGAEIKIECEEIATIKGKFELVHNHPKQKLLNQFSFWLSAIVGFIEATLTLLGKNSSRVTTASGEVLGQQNNTHSDVYSTIDYNLNSVEDLINFDIIGFLTGSLASVTGVRSAAGGLSKVNQIVKVIRAAITVITSLAVKVPFSILNGIMEADKVLDIIYKLTDYADYVYQYNSVATFNQSICIEKEIREEG